MSGIADRHQIVQCRNLTKVSLYDITPNGVTEDKMRS